MALSARGKTSSDNELLLYYNYEKKCASSTCGFFCQYGLIPMSLQRQVVQVDQFIHFHNPHGCALVDLQRTVYNELR